MSLEQQIKYERKRQALHDERYVEPKRTHGEVMRVVAHDIEKHEDRVM